MRVIRLETTEGVLQTITFEREGAEENFQLAVKTWIATNAPMGWEEFFNRAERIDNNSIILRMT